MRSWTLTVCAFAMFAVTGFAQSKEPLVEFGMMTWPEVKAALAAGKTTILIYNGGTEQRGPQNVNGGHTLIATEVSRRIALKLGNALVAPVLPYSPNSASATLPGTIGLTPEIFKAVNERVAEEAIKTGFKNVVLMGDHGGRQKELEDLAKELDGKHSADGVHVIFCDQVYAGTKEHPGAQPDFEKWLVDNRYPAGSHAGISDTSEMLYLGGDKVRFEGPDLDRGWRSGGRRGQERDPNAKRINNGITGVRVRQRRNSASALLT